MDKIGIYYFRSLYSQSACSLSVGKFSDFLINRGYKTNLHLLKNDNHIGMIEEHEDMLKNDIIIYKTNYKDFEYGIRLFENILTNSNKLFYLAGPFAIMNRERILKKYSFVKDVIDIQNSDEISKIFPSLGNIIKKNTTTHKKIGIINLIKVDDNGLILKLGNSFTNSTSSR